MNIAQQIVNGLVLGSGFACVALGWTILLGVARLVNFAHGQLYMLGAFVTWYAMVKAGLPYPLAILASIITLAILGALLQGAMMRLVMTQNLTSLMIVTLGFGAVGWVDDYRKVVYKDPKGMFKRGAEIKVWIAQSGANLPVKMQLALKFGAATLWLSDYKPPASAAAAASK